MKLYTINSRESVKDFLFDLHLRIGGDFTPEDDLYDFKDENGFPVFTKEEAAYLDDVMLYCYVFCLDNSLDIHEIAEEAWFDIHL